MKIGDLVKFKAHCRPGWDHHHRVFLVDREDAFAIGLHGPPTGIFAKENFILVRKANENR